jgi:hypothetical protein
MAIAYVNGVGNYGGIYATTIAAPAANHTAGNLLVVFVGLVSSTATVSSIADTAGNTYTYVASIVYSAYYRIECWYAKNITGNANNVVTVTYSASVTYRTITVDQYSGCDPSAPLDQYNTGSGNSAAPTTGNITTTSADEVLVAGVHLDANKTITAGANYTKRTLTDPAPSFGASEDRIVSATGTYNATFSLNSAAGWVIIVASFKAAAVAGPAAVGSSMAAKMMAAGVL